MSKKLIYVLFFMLVLGLAQGEARGAYLAAWWDGDYPTTIRADETLTVAVRDALEAAGYEILNSDQLKTWMDARIADGVTSVVVFCRDIAPDTVIESMSSRCTLRRYLDAGGKIVWYADIPFWNQGHAGGGMTNWSASGATGILGFNAASAWDGGGATITDEGIEWGLTDTWNSVRGTDPGLVDIVLATDNAGNAAAWVKHYVPGDIYGGFVRIWDAALQSSSRPNVDDIMRVAEYGLGGNPYARRPNPADGAVHADTWASMSWFAGDFAVSHDVYFSDNFDDVEAGTKDTFQGNQTATYFAVGSARSPYLVPGVTYYWRVDEVEEDGTIHTGDVWSFSILPEISITDLSIVGWWRFDEGYGTTVSDSSGYGNHGTFGPQPYDPQWVPGMFGYALEFDGDDYVDVGNSSTLNFGIDNWTVTGWVKTTMGTGSSGILFGNGGAQSGGIRYTLHVKGTACLITDDDSTKVELKGSTSVADDVWHHLAGVRDGTTLFVYVDGELDGTDTLADGYDLSGTAQHNAYIGAVIDNRNGSLTMHLVGLIDDVCVFSKALTEDEIVRVMKGEVVTARFQAFNPNPPDGATDVPWDDVVLGWIPGDYADKHDVYFGTNFNDVNDADRTNPLGVLVSQDQVPDSYSIAEVLQWEKTYYWRVDEIEADGVTIHKGDIWSFSIPPKTASVLGHFAITYYDNYNYDTDQWDAWQSAATPRDAWDDKYLADGLSGNTVYTDHAFTSIAVFNLRGGFFSKDGHASGEDWNPLQSIGDNVSGQSAHHVFAALFKGLIYLEEGDVLWVASDDDVYVFLDDETKWGQEVLSVPSVSFFDTDSMTVTAAQAGYHTMTVKHIERRNVHSGIEITLNGEHLQSAEVAHVVTVPGTACIFFAGQDRAILETDYPPDPVGRGGGRNFHNDTALIANSMPPHIGVYSGSKVSISAEGIWGHSRRELSGPDGYDKPGWDPTHYEYVILGGISRVTARRNALLGVFLTDDPPDPGAMPPELTSPTTTPLLQQAFAIGSSLENITVPEGATRLFFGLNDGFEWNNNVGSLEVTVATIVGIDIKEDFETRDFSKFPWEHHGDASWTVTSYEKNSGAYSARTGTIDHHESTTLRVTLDCVSGDITFYRKVSSELDYDHLVFYIDSVKMDKWSGKEDWAEVSFPVDEGTRTFEWTYSKDDSISDGDDTAWIDDIVFPIN